MRPIIDAHLDLAWNALYFNRDLLSSVAEVRHSEATMTDEPARGRNTLTLPELQRARVVCCVGTLMGRSGPDVPKRVGFARTSLDYATPEIVYAHAHGQLAYYRWLESQGHARLILTKSDLQSHWQSAGESAPEQPLGIILGMEGADAIVQPAQLEAWWKEGLRCLGPVHYGRSNYACGTGTNGPVSRAGIELLREIKRLGMILDVTHLSDQSFFETMALYDGPIMASHHNCRALVPGDRQLSDEQIKLLLERQAIIGAAFDAWMLYPGWKRGETKPEVVGIEAAANHIDHICQIAGGTAHCALGTDLDGGFGTEQTPRDLDTYTDLHKLEGILEARGYQSEDIDNIFFGNWLRFFGRTLP